MSSTQPLPFDGLTPEIRDLLRPPKSFVEMERDRLLEVTRLADPVIQARDAAREQLKAFTTARGVYEMFSTSRYLDDPFKAMRAAHKEAADQIAKSVRDAMYPRASMPL